MWGDRRVDVILSTESCSKVSRGRRRERMEIHHNIIEGELRVGEATYPLFSKLQEKRQIHTIRAVPVSLPALHLLSALHHDHIL